MRLPLKSFKKFAGHYRRFGPKKVKKIESRPERLDDIVDARTSELQAISRYHDELPHPYHH